MKKSTTFDFIEKAKLIHGNKYDYSLVNYESSMKYVKICYENKIYEQTPACHLSGFCPEKKVLKTNNEIFISNSKKIHGDKYDYSLVNYKDRYSKIKIIRDNIIYEQTPDMHLRGLCPEMKPENKTTAEFIEQSKSLYGDKYDYSLTNYINKLTKIKIIYNGIIYEQYPRIHFNTPPEQYGESVGEIKIKKILTDKNINYISQYGFNDCKNKYKLRYDFYLPKYNILIEYDGIQHFKPIKFFGGEKTFNETIINDNLKNLYAKKKNIPLLRISYKELNSITDILNKFFLQYYCCNIEEIISI